MAKEKIINLIEKAIQQAQEEKKLMEFEIPEILVEHPENMEFGDFSTNIAMRIAKIAKKSPMDVAEIINNQLVVDSKILGKVEVSKPGFINFFISKRYLQKQVKEILEKGDEFGQLEIGKNKKINIEFISGNPTGPLHIGQGRGAFFGDCLANILRKAGYKVVREYFINNAKNSNQIKELGKTVLGKGVSYSNDELKELMKKHKLKNKKFKSDGEAGYFLGQIIQKQNRNFIENKLKIKFDNWALEEDLYKDSKLDKAYKLLEKQDLVYKKDGAEWLKTTKFGDKQDWVLKRATGSPTYLLSDIAYHKDKFDKKFSKVIDIWGADHQGHVFKMKAVAKMLGYRGDLDILICQVVRLKGGLKLSKRKGQIITLEELIDEVGMDVARYFYLVKSLDTQMEFDMALAKEQSEKNPVYYIQYAHARISSILRKASIKDKRVVDYKLLDHKSELNLINQLIRFSEIIEDTANDYQTQRIPKYATELANAFHQFYHNCKVISDNKELSSARIALIDATKIVLKNTLDLMGITVPKKM